MIANYISRVDCISLINRVCQLYGLDQKDFDDVPYEDIRALGYKILGGARVISMTFSSNTLYRLSRAVRDAEIIASRDPKKIARRLKNKWLGRHLGRLWRLWRGQLDLCFQLDIAPCALENWAQTQVIEAKKAYVAPATWNKEATEATR